VQGKKSYGKFKTLSRLVTEGQIEALDRFILEEGELFPIRGWKSNRGRKGKKK